MEGSASVVIPDGEGDLGLLKEEANDVDVGTAAGHVDERFPELVAAAEVFAGFEQGAEGGDVAAANGVGFPGIVRGDLFLCGLGEEI